MESVASTSSPTGQGHRSHHRFKPTQPFADRVLRAVTHHLRLLQRLDSIFFVLGATGNVYTVTLSSSPSCTCPDRATPCKHILFVLIRVLGIPLDDTCLWRRTLRPCQVDRLLNLPTSAETLAGPRVRERFRELFFRGSGQHQQQGGGMASVETKDGATCPVCLEEMGGGEKVVVCGTCRNPIHEECLLTWKNTSRRRTASCVICRARWRERAQQETYLNLSAYVSEDENTTVEGGNHFHCGD